MISGGKSTIGSTIENQSVLIQQQENRWLDKLYRYISIDKSKFKINAKGLSIAV